jgi:hypothetical protein
VEFQMDHAIEVLAETPTVMNALLRGKSNVWLHGRKTPDSFSPVDVVGHLIIGEMTDWLPRIRTILDHQDTRAFEPFDRFAFESIIDGKSVEELLDRFAELRAESLQTLRNLEVEEKLDLPGKHPAFGHVTMGNLLATWVVHDLGHISQVVKTMSSQYRDAVGPWREYLTVLE